MRRTLSASLALVALLATGCAGSEAATSDVCSEPTTEDLDPASGLHVLRADEVVYSDLTPTSGPHLAIAAPTGSLRTTASGAAQVTLLESGGAVISVRSDLEEVRAAAEALVGDQVLLHPVAGLDDAVVVTLWRSRIRCSELDAAYVEAFIASRSSGPDTSHE